MKYDDQIRNGFRQEFLSELSKMRKTAAPGSGYSGGMTQPYKPQIGSGYSGAGAMPSYKPTSSGYSGGGMSQPAKPFTPSPHTPGSRVGYSPWNPMNYSPGGNWNPRAQVRQSFGVSNKEFGSNMANRVMNDKSFTGTPLTTGFKALTQGVPEHLPGHQSLDYSKGEQGPNLADATPNYGKRDEVYQQLRSNVLHDPEALSGVNKVVGDKSYGATALNQQGKFDFTPGNIDFKRLLQDHWGKILGGGAAVLGGGYLLNKLFGNNDRQQGNMPNIVINNGGGGMQRPMGPSFFQHA